MTKAELVSKLRKAYAAEEFFPGCLGNPVGVAARWGLRPSDQRMRKSPDKEKAAFAQAGALAGLQPVEIEVGDTIELPKRDANTIRLRGQKTIYARIANAIVTTHGREKSGAGTQTPKVNVEAVLVRSSGNSAFRIVELADGTVAFQKQGSFKVRTIIGRLKRRRGIKNIRVPLQVEAE